MANDIGKHPAAAPTDAQRLAAAYALTFAGLNAYSPEGFGVSADPSADNAVGLQAWLNACLEDGKPARIDRPYSTALQLSFGCDLDFGRGGKLTALAPMDAVLKLGNASERAKNRKLRGLRIDADDLADRCLWLSHYSRIDLKEVQFFNARSRYLQIGDPSIPSTSFGLVADDIMTERDKGVIRPGSACIYIDGNATDSIIGLGEIKDAATGVEAHSGNNLIRALHCWAHPDFGVMDTGFDDWASGNIWSGNQADTCGVYGFRIRSANARLLGNTVFNNSVSGSDNVVIGVHFDQTSPNSMLIGNRFFGADAAHRLAKDFDMIAVTGSTITGNQANNVVAPDVDAFVVSDGASRAMSFNGDTLSFNHGGKIYIVASGSTGQFIFQTEKNTEALNLQPSGAAKVQGTWRQPLYLGEHALWVNATSGKLYKKNGTPTSDTDGTVVGTET